MKQKITTILGAAQAARVETKAAARGIADIWQRAEDRARAELPATAADDEVAALAATRAQQIAGVIPRLIKQAEDPQPAPQPAAEDKPARPRREKPTDAAE